MHPMHQKKRLSLSKAPDYSTKAAVADVASGRKKTPGEVDYRPAAKDALKRCHECVSYTKPGEPESECTKVVGTVVQGGVCDLWVQRDYDYTDNTDKTGTTVEISIKSGG